MGGGGALGLLLFHPVGGAHVAQRTALVRSVVASHRVVVRFRRAVSSTGGGARRFRLLDRRRHLPLEGALDQCVKFATTPATDSMQFPLVVFFERIRTRATEFE